MCNTPFCIVKQVICWPYIYYIVCSKGHLHVQLSEYIYKILILQLEWQQLVANICSTLEKTTLLLVAKIEVPQNPHSYYN
jgi:hypothetical protein